MSVPHPKTSLLPGIFVPTLRLYGLGVWGVGVMGREDEEAFSTSKNRPIVFLKP